MLPCFFHDVFSRFSSQNRFSRFQLFFPTFGPGIRTRPCQKPSTHSPARFHRRYLLGHVLWGELFCAASVLWKMVISGEIMGISMEYPHQYTHYIPGLVDFKPQKNSILGGCPVDGQAILYQSVTHWDSDGTFAIHQLVQDFATIHGPNKKGDEVSETNSRGSSSHSGWWYTYPSEKWWSSSVGIMKFPIYWKS